MFKPRLHFFLLQLVYNINKLLMKMKRHNILHIKEGKRKKCMRSLNISITYILTISVSMVMTSTFAVFGI